MLKSPLRKCRLSFDQKPSGRPVAIKTLPTRIHPHTYDVRRNHRCKEHGIHLMYHYTQTRNSIASEGVSEHSTARKHLAPPRCMLQSWFRGIDPLLLGIREFLHGCGGIPEAVRTSSKPNAEPVHCLAGNHSRENLKNAVSSAIGDFSLLI